MKQQINFKHKMMMKNFGASFLLGMIFMIFLTPVHGQGGNVPDSILTRREMARQARNEAITQNTLQMDSLTGSIISLQKELGDAVENIEELTERIEDNTYFDWRAWVAWIVAIVALIVAWITYRAQIKTEGNTKKLSQDTQRHLLNDLLRHLYRNYVITYAMRTKMEEIDYRGYPSEEHFQKLKIPMENIHLDAFYGEDSKYKTMHVLYLNFRNYNEEIDVAMKHMTDPNLGVETKKEDFDTLEFKVSYLTGRIADVITKIWNNGEFDEETRHSLQEGISVSLKAETNATNNQDTSGSGDFTPLTTEQFQNTQYARIYTTPEEINHFVSRFNEDVKTERMKNERGAWKVRIIRF